LKKALYFKQAELLLQILPFFMPEKVFALKGGTAINFFFRNLPRLSVDIDLTYLPINKRKIAIAEISERLEKVLKQIIKQFPKIEIVKKTLYESNKTIGLIIKRGDVTIKIEPNLVLRGTVFKPLEQRLCKKAEELFEKTMSFSTLSFADIYGGKICAALDRQHPRDLYDVYLLRKNEGITEKIRKAFIVYLISHPRPIVELLDPNPQNINDIYNKEFIGLTFEQVSPKELTDIRMYLIKEIKKILTINEQNFLISFKSLNPNWELLGLENISELPAVKWKLLNLQKMNKAKHKKALEKLIDYFEV